MCTSALEKRSTHNGKVHPASRQEVGAHTLNFGSTVVSPTSTGRGAVIQERTTDDGKRLQKQHEVPAGDGQESTLSSATFPNRKSDFLRRSE